MRKQQITVSLDKELRILLTANAEREGRSLANYARLLLDRAAREAARAQQVESRQGAAA